MGSNLTEASLRLRRLEGCRVNLSLANGSQLEDVGIVSAGRGGLSSLWLERNGIDLFIDKAEILDVCEVQVDQAA
jgi:hypothetical protein